MNKLDLNDCQWVTEDDAAYIDPDGCENCSWQPSICHDSMGEFVREYFRTPRRYVVHADELGPEG